jgi:GT2 family glycosyltransferase
MTGLDAAGRLPQLAVVVVNFRSHPLLERNLVRIGAENPEARVVVVDNFSDRHELDRVRRLAVKHGWTLVESPTNLGFGAGMNSGAARAVEMGTDHLLLLNPDAYIDAISIHLLQKALDTDPHRMVSPVIETPDGGIWFDGLDLERRTGRITATRQRSSHDADGTKEMWLTGAAPMIGATLWQQVGGFDHRYFLYWEDVDLSVRVRAAGGELEVVYGARAVHDEGGTQERRLAHSKSSSYYYYNIRNRLLFVGLHGDRAMQRRWMLGAVPAAHEILLRGGRRQFLRPGLPVVAAVKGTWDGWRAMRAASRSVPPPPSTLVVLESFPEPGTITNPYVNLLRQALEAEPHVDVRVWSWREALMRRHDVFHAHWPEVVVSNGNPPLKKAARHVLVVLFFVKMAAQGTAVVRTIHNLELPRDISRGDARLLRILERHTDVFIHLNDSTPTAPGRDALTIPHGHYRPWFENHSRPPQVPGRVAYFGMIRRYKCVEDLVSAFHATQAAAPHLSLTVRGLPSSQALVEQLLITADGDPRISFRFEFLSDSQLVATAAEAELIVLPYREMHNSGSALAALSLDRPVLVPDNDVNRTLSEEVGPGWVHLYHGDLTAQHLIDTMAALHRPRSARPDLSRREWADAAVSHIEAFHRARDVADSSVLRRWGHVLAQRLHGRAAR